jgi:thiamine-phosphate pyrophosphorylase
VRTRVPRLHCLVDATVDVGLLPDLVSAGVDGFQIRDKTLDASGLVAFVDAVLDVVRPLGARVIVNDRLDVALATQADGVHLGSGDLPIAAARRIAPTLTIGATCRTRAAVVVAAEAGATYAGFGPVFSNTGKAGLPDPLGPEALTPAADVLPLVAIGGIDATTAGRAREAGAYGLAVIGGIWGQPDPVAAARAIAEATCR